MKKFETVWICPWSVIASLLVFIYFFKKRIFGGKKVILNFYKMIFKKDTREVSVTGRKILLAQWVETSLFIRQKRIRCSLLHKVKSHPLSISFYCFFSSFFYTFLQCHKLNIMHNNFDTPVGQDVWYYIMGSMN